ncbi:co-chaperone GroES [Bdellovibrio sp. NC01]|uniref:co-chaperone GroES n=1 Tax=Bdellovibrio sp. NC01 TaxID=2220073 RepID=UPI001FEDD432|nr:co-chaperone GroES [Bdellovibrio sp. NC01]
MAKKKSSAKQTKKASPKKASVKKTAKTTAKAAPKKKTSPKAKPKVVAKKKAPVKAKAKTAAKKSAPAKKAVKKATPVKSAKKTQTKAPAKAVAKPAAQHLLKPAAPKKALDLSQFVTPLDDRMIVQVSGAERMTAGGLYIPDTVADTSGNLEGTVVAVGRGHVSKKGHLRPMDVAVGDKVVFSEYAGSKIKIQNEDLIIIREGDVMGVVAK